VGEDACAGASTCRSSELQQFDVKAHEILKRAAIRERFTALMRFQAERAHRLYDEAWPCCPPPTAAPRSPA
jgi:phytoene synthase